jgi:peroxiredoxin
MQKQAYLATSAAGISCLTMLMSVVAIGQTTRPSQDDATPASLVGKPAPDFALPDLSGTNHSLAETKGHVVVLDFWGTWCVPCHLALPHVDQLYQQDSPQGLKVFAIDNGDEKDAVVKYVSDHHLTLPVLLDADSTAVGSYKVDEFPQTVVIGKDGTVQNVFIGFKPDTSPAALEKAVSDAMNQADK